MRSRFLTLLAGTLLVSSSLFAIAHGGMLGPNAEPIFDTNGNGIPDAGDSPLSLPFNPMTGGMTIVSPYDCQGLSNNVGFSVDGMGKYGTVTRTADNGEPQELTIGAFDSNGFPTTFNFAELFGSSIKAGPSPSAVAPKRQGVGTLVDTNSDGAYDQLQLTGTGPFGPVSLNLDLVYIDSTGGSNPDYVSLPWGALQTANLVTTPSCLTSAPQIFVPLANTDGDGHPDSIVLDLDGNGQPDPTFYRSPRLVAAIVAVGVPTVSQWAALFLSFSLCAAALITLRRRGFSLSI